MAGSNTEALIINCCHIMPKHNKSDKKVKSDKKGRRHPHGFAHLVHEDDIDKADHELSKKKSKAKNVRTIYDFFEVEPSSFQVKAQEEKKAPASEASNEAIVRKSKKRKVRRRWVDVDPSPPPSVPLEHPPSPPKARPSK